MRGWALGLLLAAGAGVPAAVSAQAAPPDAGRHHGGDRGAGGGDRHGPEQARPAAPGGGQFAAQGGGNPDRRGDAGRWRGGGAPADARLSGGSRAGGMGPRDHAPGDQRPGFDGHAAGGRGPDGRGPAGGGGPVGRLWDGHGPRVGGPVDGGFGFGRGGPPVATGSGGYRPQGWPARSGGGWHGGGGDWSRTWRDDRRYDWRSYRITNRYVFNLPRYDAPEGWRFGYRRFQPGFTLSAALFGEDYWIDDPYSYRLPAAYGPYRWVRYYGDALLIDVRSGTVVDAVYGIFW